MEQLRKKLALSPPEPGECLGDSFIPAALRDKPELLRRARLQVRFGLLGAVFGTLYASFYFLIGHGYGAGIIVICSSLFALVPWLVKKGKPLAATGHFYAAVLVSGFSALCAIEGGLHGHAIAWLAAIPLCALLLVELRGAVIWSAICALVVAGFAVWSILGHEARHFYPMKWEPVISAAGYVGLVLFMSILGIIFERTRDRAVKETNLLLLNLKETNAALEELNHALEHMNREKNEFMNIAAHDLKNPLSAISGHAQLLEIFSSGTPDQVLETAGVIRRQTQQMLDIISNLLDVRKIEEGCMELKLVPCDARKVMEEVVNDYQQRAGKKSIALRLTGECGVQVQADLAAIRQILDNLVSNALKYSPPHTTVQCAVVPGEDSISLQIIDEGPGLSEEDQEKLFRKFTRLTPVPTAGESSNGLGLWIVRRIANSMRGEVFCRSILGKGSCFELRLPAAPGA